MIYIDIHRQRVSKNWAYICRFVLSPWGNYREFTVCTYKKNLFKMKVVISLEICIRMDWDNFIRDLRQQFFLI